MTCPRCGTGNPPGARFCHSCGARLAGAAPASAEPSPAAAAPSRPAAWLEEIRSSLSRGWGTAATRAGLTLLAAVLFAQVVSVVQSLAQPQQVDGPDVVRLGGLFFYAFHHVAIRMDLSGLPGAGDLPLAGAFDITLSFTAALLLATAAVGWLLFRAGRAVAVGAGGPWWVRPLHGMKPAVPYAAASFLLSFAVRISLPPPAATGELQGAAVVLGPSAWSALAWPFLLAAILGAAGGFFAARGEAFRREWGGWARGALAGGWRMTWLALALAFGGLLVLAVVKPQDAAAYFRLVSSGTPIQGAFIVVLTALLVPNLASAVAAAAMGGSVMVGLLGSSCTLLSYARFPRGIVEPPDFGPAFFQDPCAAIPVRFETAPPGYFLFLLVPLAATVLGGWLAARRAEVVVRRDAALAGAAAGAVFAVFFAGIALLGRFTSDAEGALVALVGGASSSVGPSLAGALLLGLVWGVFGGSVGGAIHRPPEAPRPSGFRAVAASPGRAPDTSAGEERSAGP